MKPDMKPHEMGSEMKMEISHDIMSIFRAAMESHNQHLALVEENTAVALFGFPSAAASAVPAPKMAHSPNAGPL